MAKAENSQLEAQQKELVTTNNISVWQWLTHQLERLFIISNNSGIYSSEKAILQQRLTNV